MGIWVIFYSGKLSSRINSTKKKYEGFLYFTTVQNNSKSRNNSRDFKSIKGSNSGVSSNYIGSTQKSSKNKNRLSYGMSPKYSKVGLFS